MDRNYCFRRKRHSYAACDAALAASHNILRVYSKHYGENENARACEETESEFYNAMMSHWIKKNRIRGFPQTLCVLFWRAKNVFHFWFSFWFLWYIKVFFLWKYQKSLISWTLKKTLFTVSAIFKKSDNAIKQLFYLMDQNQFSCV